MSYLFRVSDTQVSANPRAAAKGGVVSGVLHHARVELQEHERAETVCWAGPERPEDFLLRRVAAGVAELHRVVYMGHQTFRAERRPEHHAHC